MRITPSSRALIALTLLVGLRAFGQAEAGSDAPATTASAPKPVGELWQVRLRYGLAYRNGGQQDVGPGLTYSGLTPNDFALLGWAWLGYAGLHLHAQREGFALFNGQPGGTTPAEGQVTGGGLLRFSAQAAGRLPLGPLRLEPYLGYAFHQLPTFRGADGSGSTLAPQFAVATRHSLLLAARVLLDVGRLTFEVRGEVPLALASSVPGASSAVSNGFAVGGGARVQLFHLSKLHLGVLLDAQYLTDNLAGKDAAGSTVVASQQRVARFGLSLDVRWQDVDGEPTSTSAASVGGIIVRVLDVDSGAPLPGASVTLNLEGDERALTPDRAGALAARSLPVGPFTVRASAVGYLPFESAGAVTAGIDTPIELRLKKEPPKVGGLQIVVKERESGKALSGVAVTVAKVTVKSDGSGLARFEGLTPGPVAIALVLEGYRRGEEAASVVAATVTDVPVSLVPEKQKVPATITGLVRNARGGTPIAADLEVPQAKIKTRASEKGAFTLRVEGGTYTVKISAPGYMAQTKDVTVRDGDQAIFNVDLYPK